LRSDISQACLSKGWLLIRRRSAGFSNFHLFLRVSGVTSSRKPRVGLCFGMLPGSVVSGMSLRLRFDIPIRPQFGPILQASKSECDAAACIRRLESDAGRKSRRNAPRGRILSAEISSNRPHVF
jgi:hypothetical protein